MNSHPFTHPLHSMTLLFILLVGLLYADTSGAPRAYAQSVQPDAVDATGRAYIVKPGDSLSKIARALFDTQSAVPAIIAATNQKAAEDASFRRVRNPNLIVAGQKLWLPNIPTTESAAGAAVAPTEAELTVRPAIMVADHVSVANQTITLDRVTTAEPGRLVIHRSRAGAPGAVLGAVNLAAGETTNVRVALRADLPLGARVLAALYSNDAPDNTRLDSAGNTDAKEPNRSAAPLAMAPFTIGLPAPETPSDIFSRIQSSAELDVLLASFETAGMTELLRDDGPLTVFLPTNAAFSALPASTLELLLTDSDMLQNVLQYHVVADAVRLSDRDGASSFTTVQGAPLRIDLTVEQVLVNEGAVLVADAVATNGVIHIIEHVLLPPSMANAVRVAEQPDVSTLDSRPKNQTTNRTANGTALAAEPQADAERSPFAPFAPRSLFDSAQSSTGPVEEPASNVAISSLLNMRDRLRNTVWSLSPQSTSSQSATALD